MIHPFFTFSSLTYPVIDISVLVIVTKDKLPLRVNFALLEKVAGKLENLSFFV